MGNEISSFQEFARFQIKRRHVTVVKLWRSGTRLLVQLQGVHVKQFKAMVSVFITLWNSQGTSRR